MKANQKTPAAPVAMAPAAAHDLLWNKDICLELLTQLWALRRSMLDSEARYAKAIEQVGPHQRASARNLVHYLALRAIDLRALQERLAWLGVSSLGRSESHVLANVDKVIGILHRLTGQPWQDHSPEEPGGSVTGQQLLQSHAKLLLGPALRDRTVRIMVTLPSEAASDYGLVRRLVHAGMDVARINCAHDDARAWTAMAELVRRAAKASQRRRCQQRISDIRGARHGRRRLAEPTGHWQAHGMPRRARKTAQPAGGRCGRRRCRRRGHGHLLSDA